VGADIFELKFFETPAPATWDYDEGADVLYLAIGEPRPALGIDLGDGIILNTDVDEKEVVGLTIIGLRKRLMRELTASRKAH
jgi:uncharacterized protein YuzE